MPTLTQTDWMPTPDARILLECYEQAIQDGTLTIEQTYLVAALRALLAEREEG